MIENIDPKILKIVALAKHGVGGERDTAIRLVKSICEREGLEFDDVMADGVQTREYVLLAGYKNSVEETIVAQVCFKFAVTDAHPNLNYNSQRKAFFYTCTAAQHLETVNAAAIYLRAFRKERKKFMDDLMAAFVQKHRLFGNLTKDKSDDEERPPTDIKKLERMIVLGQAMDDVNVHKSLGSGK